ncbi:MAG TPA: M24 family metallopeptidase [Aggregatilinea sp.]|uniref:M24 family metallopeptidase n=1 Tax=Aggregatilinea sp. TaxID=2806333 RepID=UPI002B580548|nr:M24 family metallopeptidase [Aggregatilinea sp.]HML24670.1 M24 family metallopeptidase [Aggregatilinea sp.]
MDYKAEVQTKLDQLRSLMAEHGLGALWLRRIDNFAWLTGGIDTAINVADIAGGPSILVTPDAATVWTNRIEAPRLDADGLSARGFDLHVSAWEAEEAPHPAGRFGTDIAHAGASDVSGDLQALRLTLSENEQQRFRALGADCAKAMDAAIKRVQPGQTEAEIGGGVADELRRYNITPVVVLIATDERIFKFRHPLPTMKTLDKYAMLVLCGRREGLVCSVTRLVHFGPINDDLRHRIEACTEIDARITAASRPGQTLDDMFKTITEAYAAVGFADEWQLHHQGGLAAYNPREIIAMPGDATTIKPGMICAWNPSITGSKVEDTILVTDGAPEILTAIPGWPTKSFTIDGVTYARPVILEK